MDLADFLSQERGRTNSLARFLSVPGRVPVAPGYISQMASGKRPVPPELVPGIEEFSGLLVRRWTLRRSDWHRIWPESIGSDGAPPIPSAEAA